MCLVTFAKQVTLLVLACKQDFTKPTNLISMKFGRSVSHGPRKNLLNFEANQSHRAGPEFSLSFGNFARYGILGLVSAIILISTIDRGKV